MTKLRVRVNCSVERAPYLIFIPKCQGEKRTIFSELSRSVSIRTDFRHRSMNFSATARGQILSFIFCAFAGPLCSKIKSVMKTTRRSALKTASLFAASAALGTRLQAADSQTKGRVNHSVCKWCYPKQSVEDLCVAGKEFGLHSVELLQPTDFPTLKKHDMTCAMVSSPDADGHGLGGIERAWNRLEHHDKLVDAYEQRIKEVADAGMVNLICFSGNRKGLD